jgi:hypothetical protein
MNNALPEVGLGGRKKLQVLIDFGFGESVQRFREEIGQFVLTYSNPRGSGDLLRCGHCRLCCAARRGQEGK